MKNAYLIVLSGEAGAGKDSVAKMLVDQHGWKMYSISAPLKRFAGDMFGFTDEQLYGQSKFRNEPDPRWARPCKTCHSTGKVISMRALVCDRCDGTGKINDNSPRRILQLAGEEFLRQMIHVDALTMRARPELEAMLLAGDKIVINDGRNENDRNNLYEWLGASRVDVRAPNKQRSKNVASWRLHKSELSRPTDEQIEYVLVNDEPWPFVNMGSKIDVMLEKLYGL